MKITDIRYYGGARDKIARLGLAHLFLEVQQIILDTKVFLLEEKDANSGAVVREALDKGFVDAKDWHPRKTGGIDWTKRLRYNETVLSRMGVEVQVSARSDLVVRDLIHLRNKLQESEIDIGVIIVPSDRMEVYLPDRYPRFGEAVKYVEQEFKEAMLTPLVIISIEHDGPARTSLAKKKRKR
jgi:hypothetical protein